MGKSRRGPETRRYKTILESLDDAVYAVTTDGTIAYVNERYADMKGMSQAELIGTDIYDLVTEETAEKAREQRRVMADGEQITGVVEYDFLTVDGDRFPVEMRFNRLPDDERGDDASELDRVGVIRDVSEQRRREEALKEKNERLEEFTGIVSHDLRNPLSVAEGRLELAREECDSEHLDAVADAHERMETLIDDLLTLARDGDEIEGAERVPLRELVEACWAGVETAAASLRVETDRVVYADRSRLRQVFENLVRNAIEHGGEDVMVTVGDVTGGFYVVDDGPGIPKSDRESVFEPGFTTNDDGTGFGLEIIDAVASAHGWDVRVTGPAGGGARFEFTGVDVLD
ncbi:two-component system sensor histidine kinase NtrB [Halorubrum sp. HHNYT27]|uniref:two-component system sensor histidine kinase NtrB n=1 Tax=Halorubrum sp. HHNYT27 TaxID=3402275 RepID=UPI003EB89EDA